MRAFVFTDSSLKSEAGRFVWLEINSEKATNAPFLKKYPIVALPTFLILDPADERVALRWVGGATLPQLKHWLADGREIVAGGPAGAGSHELLFARAESLYAAGRDSAAVPLYQRALATAPAGWTHRARAVESLLFALDQIGDVQSEVRLASDEYPALARTPSAANVAASGLEAALQLPAQQPDRAARIAEFESYARKLAADRSVPMAGDDRSAVYISLLDARQDAADSVGAHAVALEWSAFLDAEAAAAKTPFERSVFDSHRLSAYLELGTPERAIPMLEASERDFPDDYNPPARLAVAYRAMKNWNAALAASDRALARAYGPRMLGMLQVRSDIYLGMSDSTGARRTLDQAVATAESFPDGQRSERTIAALKKKRSLLN
jgi:tetratricopeptide (TPR) repeat protein